ncbi:MAG: diguanylate cyclase [Mariprofundaceae bacterium]
MSEVQKHIDILMEDMDTIRPYVLSGDDKNVEARSILRRMLSHLDQIQRIPLVSTSRHLQITSLFSQLWDAEHGMLIKSNDSELSDEDREQLTGYVDERKHLLESAQQDVGSSVQLIDRCNDLLGKEKTNVPDLSGKCQNLEKNLRSHLQDDARLRVELNSLTSAFQSSLEAMNNVLEEVGDESPELQEIQTILSMELPDNPEEAQALLRNAKDGLLQAGQKLTHASTAIKDTMQNQAEQMTTLTKQLEKAESEARNDPLTGLANRRRLAEYLKATTSEVASFLMVDIDFFKKINDEYGHDAGDEVLVRLAQILMESTRSTDMVARLGGEEFCIVFPGANSELASELAESLRRAVEIHSFETEQGAIDVTISIGIAEQQPEEKHTSWLKRADKALYDSKNNGRNRVTLAK